jgi:hypothetical protein
MFKGKEQMRREIVRKEKQREMEEGKNRAGIKLIKERRKRGEKL